MGLDLKNTLVASVAVMVSMAASAHPGHEPEDLLHALAHEIASPRGLLVLLALGVGGALWAVRKARTKKW